MKNNLAALVALIFCGAVNLYSQGTAFTYQGKLASTNGAAASGSYDLTFTLFPAAGSGSPVSSTITNSAVTISADGLLTTTVDFGVNLFNGADRWLEIAVRTNGAGAFSTLVPRQQISAAPYAIYASNAANAVLLGGVTATAYSTTSHTHSATQIVSGTLSDARLSANIPRLDTNNVFAGTNRFAGVVIATNQSNVIAGMFSGNGSGLTSLNGGNIVAGSISNGALASGTLSHLDSPDGAPLNVVQVSSNGYVGIGTNAPASALYVAKTFAATTLTRSFEVADGDETFTNIGSPYAVASAGSLTAVASGSEGGVTIFDVSSAGAVTLRSQFRDGEGSFTNLAGANSVALRTNLLAIGATSDDAVTLVTLTNPAAPLKLSEMKDGVGSYTSLNGVSSVAMFGNLLAIGSALDNAVTLVDISNPAAPVRKVELVDGTFGYTNLANVKSVALTTNLLAIASYNDDTVTLVNVSDPANPVKLVEINATNGFPNMHNAIAVAFSGNVLGIVSYAHVVSLFSVTNPAAPALLSEIRGSWLLNPVSLSFSTNGLLAIAAAGSAGLGLLDISNPTSPQLLATVKDGLDGFHLLNNARGVAFAGTNIAVAAFNVDSGITIARPAAAQFGLTSRGWVGVGTDQPAAPLDVTGDVIVRNSQRVTLQTEAFETGWETEARDFYSTALGFRTVAGGQSSVAAGEEVRAEGYASTAMGKSTIARGFAATALGGYCSAIGDYSFAAGEGCSAYGNSSAALCRGVTSNAYAFAAGQYCVAAGQASAAFGYYSSANGSQAVAGGYLCEANGSSAVALGANCDASGPASAAIGYNNVASGFYSTALGAFSTASGDYASSIGSGAEARANYAFALGRNAQATNNGSFVLADGSGAVLTSTNSYSATMRASGGYRLFSNSGSTAGVSLAPSSTSWGTLSDRAAKKNFADVNEREVLRKVSKLPIQHWNYKWEADDSVPHIGPMAQDFKAAFYPGRDDKTITTLEFDGVELAAIQALTRVVGDQQVELKAKADRIDKLEKDVAELKALVNTIAAKAKK